jgi:hypothetical protein
MSHSAAEAAEAANAIAAVADAALSTSNGVSQAETTATEVARSSATLEHLVIRFAYSGCIDRASVPWLPTAAGGMPGVDVDTYSGISTHWPPCPDAEALIHPSAVRLSLASR